MAYSLDKAGFEEEFDLLVGRFTYNIVYFQRPRELLNAWWGDSEEMVH